jgi:hypothetical protein
MEVVPIRDQEVFMKCLPWIREIEFTDLSALDVLARCLSGQYLGCLGIKDGKPVAIVIYYIFEQTKAYVVGLWAKNSLKGLPETFYDQLKEQGIQTVRASSVHNPEAYAKLIKMKRKITVFERVL